MYAFWSLLEPKPDQWQGVVSPKNNGGGFFRIARMT